MYYTSKDLLFAVAERRVWLVT